MDGGLVLGVGLASGLLCQRGGLGLGQRHHGRRFRRRRFRRRRRIAENLGRLRAQLRVRIGEQRQHPRDRRRTAPQQLAVAPHAMDAGELRRFRIGGNREQHRSAPALREGELRALPHPLVGVTKAQLKALGGGQVQATDASIQFSSTFAFDFNPNDGIAADKMDFVGVAAHEIGHALGFISAVDYVDLGIFPSSLIRPTTLDMLRYSDESLAQGVPDLSVGLEDKYLILGGLQIGVSTGTSNGNGNQASHFLPGVGLMQPSVGFGQRLVFAPEDYLAFEALGWQIVPEPSTYGLSLGFLAIAAVAVSRRRRSQRPPEPRQRGG